MGDIEVEGSKNQVAGRDFSDNSVSLHSVGNISLGGTQVNINNASVPDMLSPEQRRRLNRLVTEISSEHEVDPRTLWKEVVHTRTGVSTIEKIPRDKFGEAKQALLDHAEQLHAQAHAKRLIAEVLEVANQRGVYKEMTRFCSREFGSSVLTKLNPEQLKAVLRFVDEHQVPPKSVPLSWPVFRVLVLNHPWHILSVFIAGSLVGKIFL